MCLTGMYRGTDNAPASHYVSFFYVINYSHVFFPRTSERHNSHSHNRLSVAGWMASRNRVVLMDQLVANHLLGRFFPLPVFTFWDPLAFQCHIPFVVIEQSQQMRGRQAERDRQ